MRCFLLQMMISMLFFCGLPQAGAADGELVWAIESGHEETISAVFDSESDVAPPPFSVESIKIENGLIAVSVSAGDVYALVNVRNAADETEPDCRRTASVRLCISKTSNAALAAAYVNWVLPRLAETDLNGLWSRRPMPIPETLSGGVTQAYPFIKIFFSLLNGLWSRRPMSIPEIFSGGVTQAYPFIKIFFSLWFAAFAVLLAYLFLRRRNALPNRAAGVLMRVLSGLLCAALCLALTGVLFGDWPHIK